MIRRHSGIAVIGVSVGLALGVASSPAVADVLIRYQAPQSCPDEGWFRGQLALRLGRRLTEADDSMVVRLQGSGGGFRGDLEFSGDTPRTLQGATCHEVSQALALVAALQLRQRWKDFAETISGASSAAFPATAAPPTTATSPAPLTPYPAETPASPSSPEAEGQGKPVVVLKPHHSPRAPSPRSPLVRVGVGAVVALGASPSAMAGYSLGLGLDGRGRSGVSVRLHFDHLHTGTRDVAPGRATFQLIQGRSAACLPVTRHGPWRVESCLEFAAGLHDAEAQATREITTVAGLKRRPWLSLGPSLHLEVRLFDPLRTRVELGLPVPLLHRTLKFDLPEQRIHATWPVIPWVGIHLEARTAR